MPARTVVAIVGTTAVGKSAAAVSLARLIDGEIINADSRQVYRGMVIGTGTPREGDRGGVSHHLYGISEPDDDFSLGRFLDAAACAIEQIHARGRTPIIVGGTGQYVRALFEGWTIPHVPPNPGLRQQLAARAETEGRQSLHDELRRLDPAAAQLIHPNNVTRSIRALEVVMTTGRPFSEQRTKSPPPWPTRMAGISMERTALDARIQQRVTDQLDGGWIDEVRQLLTAGYAPTLPSFRSIGYREVSAHIAGRMPWDDMRQTIISKTRRLARSQAAWFRADDERISWLESSDDSYEWAHTMRQRLGLP